MAQPAAISRSHPFADRWRGVASLVCAAVAALAFVSQRLDGLGQLPEPVDTYLSVGLTWLLVILPIAGFGLALFGLARDRRKTAAIFALSLNALGLLVAAAILYILSG
jgi:hypothetical protein